VNRGLAMWLRGGHGLRRERGGEKEQGKGSGMGRKTVEVGKGKGNLGRRKRKRVGKDVDGKESEEEEVLREIEKVRRKTMIMAVGKRKP
jgi:hypothetical protein